jgi:hypothetical protein
MHANAIAPEINRVRRPLSSDLHNRVQPFAVSLLEFLSIMITASRLSHKDQDQDQGNGELLWFVPIIVS